MILLFVSLLLWQQEPESPEPQRIELLSGRLKLGGWLDGQYANSSRSEESPRFDVRQVNVHFTAMLNESWRAVGELSFRHLPRVQGEESEGEILLDRAYIEYRWRTGMHLKFGKFNTPAGLWKPQNYSVLVDTTETPVLEANEYIPNKSVGIGFFGRSFWGKTELNYAGHINNGYQDNGTEVGNDDDPGWGIDINAWILERTRFGMSLFEHKAGDMEGYYRQNLVLYFEQKIWRENLSFRAESLWRDGKPEGKLEGYYLQIKYQFHPQWYAHLRYERSDDLLEGSGEEHSVWLATLAFWPHKQVRTRLEAGEHRFEFDQERNYTAASLWMGFIF
ncbi:MAG: hypothetical protein H6510_13670 [Acidobacteria bacterium]|nr:hypothetical protein [Acidobacteriota bacterium]MCB9398856.1 hypothetical protein [Acidobacteriota bacterium]